jgi:hypothetical protein
MDLALYNQFAGAGAATATTVHRAANPQEFCRFVRSLSPAGRVGVAPSLILQQPELGQLLRGSLPPPEPDDTLNDPSVGVTLAEMGVAETGSVLLVEGDPADRLVSMLSLTLVVVVPASRLVASLDDVATWLEDRLAGGKGPPTTGCYATLVSGPSRSADIERSLTIGVQGPMALHVVVVDDVDGPAATGHISTAAVKP